MLFTDFLEKKGYVSKEKYMSPLEISEYNLNQPSRSSVLRENDKYTLKYLSFLKCNKNTNILTQSQQLKEFPSQCYKYKNYLYISFQY